MKKDTREALALILAFLVPLAPCVQLEAAIYIDPANEFIVSDDPANEIEPAISGSVVVWRCNHTGTYSSIHGKNIDTGETITVREGVSQTFIPKISGDIVIWLQGAGFNISLHSYDLRTKQHLYIDSSIFFSSDSHDIDGNMITYCRNYEEYVYLHNLTTGQNFSLRWVGYSPVISGSTLVSGHHIANDISEPSSPIPILTWPRLGCEIHALHGNIFVGAGGGNIFGKDIITGKQFTVCDNGSVQLYDIAIHANMVVWTDGRNGNRDIYGADISDQNNPIIFPICTNFAEQKYPDISGDVVVWTDKRNGNNDIYGNRILSGTVLQAKKLGADPTGAWASDPVNTATGNFYLNETDLAISGPGMNFEFIRSYNAQDSYNSPFGPGWTHIYNVYVTPDPCSTMMLVKWGDGQGHYYLPDSGDPNSYHPAIGAVYDKLKKNPDNTWTVTQKDQTRHEFDTAGKLTSIVDKNSNTISLSYDANGLDTITDTAGKVIDVNSNASGLILSLADPNNRQVTYGYTVDKLTSVTDPRGNTTYYTYDSGNGLLKTITNNRGIVDVNNVYDANDRVVQQVNGRGKISSFAYNTPSENQTTITDPLGRQTIHSYDQFLRIASMTDPNGNTISYTYDNKSNRTSITDKNGNVRYFSYDDMGNVLTMTAPRTNPGDPSTAAVTTVTYDANNNPLTKTEATGSSIQRAWTYEYNPNGNLTRIVDPNNKESLRTYITKGLLATETDKRNNVTKYSYDANSNLTDVNDALGNITHYTYDIVGRMLTKTDARGNTTTYSYDKNDNLLTEIDPNGKTINYSYDENDNKTSITDRRSNSWIYQYNENDILYREVDANGFEILYGYDDVDNRISVTDKRGKVTYYSFDIMNHLIDVNDPLGHHTSYTYDAKGSRTSQTNGLGKTWTYEYDALNRLIKETNPVDSNTTYEYDLLGRKVSVTDARGNKTQYDYDVLDRLVKVTDAIGGITEYEYDPVGNLISIINANEKLSTRDYDTLDRLIAESDPLGNTTEYQYDEVGNCTLKTDAMDQNTIYAYDALDRLVDVSYPDSNQVTYSYDENSNRIAMTDWNGSSSYEHDKLNRMTTSTDAFGNRVEYKYDAIGNRSAIVYPDGNSVTYTYDDSSRLAEVNDWNGRVTTYAYDAANHLKSVTLPNSSIQLYNYDDASRLISVQNKDKDSNSIGSFDYTLDAVGNRIEINETGTLKPIIPYSNADYTYDDADRLVSGSNCSYSFDDNGNQASRDCGSLTQYAYDPRDLLVGVSEPGLNIEHTCDGLGNRISRTVNGTEKRFVLDLASPMSQILCETDTGGNIITYYIYGTGLLAKITPDGYEHYYHYDGLGSTVALTNELGYLTDQYAYTPFGELANSQGSTDNPFKYIGRFGVMTEPDGTLFMRARFYDPKSGRFLSVDPILGGIYHPHQWHSYVYALNNPVFFSDPSGLFDFFQAAGSTVSFGFNLSKAPSDLISSSGLLIGSVFYGGVYCLTGNEDYRDFAILEGLMAQDITNNYWTRLSGGTLSNKAENFVNDNPRLRPLYDILSIAATGVPLVYNTISLYQNIHAFGEAGGIPKLNESLNKVLGRLIGGKGTISPEDVKILIEGSNAGLDALNWGFSLYELDPSNYSDNNTDTSH